MKLRRSVPAMTAGALVLAGLGVAATAPSNAAPTSSSSVPAPAAPVASKSALVRLVLNDGLAAAMSKAGISVTATGTTSNPSPRILEIPIGRTFKDGYSTSGGFTLSNKAGATLECPSLSVYSLGRSVNCVTADGVVYQLFQVTTDKETTKEGGWITDSNMTLAIDSDAAATRLNDVFGINIFRQGQTVGEMKSVRRQLLKANASDSKTACTKDDRAGDNSISRGWALQAVVNSIPENVTVSRLVAKPGKPSTVETPAAPAVTIGQKTPYMDGGETTDHKGIVRGSDQKSDNFWEGYNYGCSTLAPYVVGQGDLGEAVAWTYDGEVRTPATANNARDSWWGIPRETNKNGPTGWYKWTCRATPSGVNDTYWQRLGSGSGFVGDSESDRQNRNSNGGRAPACRDSNFSKLDLTTRYSISKRGGLEPRNMQKVDQYPRYCSVAGSPLAGCWQEIYPASWDRAWNFQYHVYASSLASRLTSDARIKVPAEFDQVNGTGFTKPISWRITDATVSGAWPKFVGNDGKTHDLSGVKLEAGKQDWSKVSPFTVLGGSRQAFTLSGYGTPMGRQTMTYTLTADTDGTWTWPVDADGNELPRPQVKLTSGLVISNFDNGTTCKEKTWYDNSWFSGTTDTSGNRCLEGKVPTIWPLPTNTDDMNRLVHDDYVTKDGKTEKVVPTTTFDSTIVDSCWTKGQLKVQDLSTPEAPTVGASYTWDIKLTGLIDSWSGCV